MKQHTKTPAQTQRPFDPPADLAPLPPTDGKRPLHHNVVAFDGFGAARSAGVAHPVMHRRGLPRQRAVPDLLSWYRLARRPEPGDTRALARAGGQDLVIGALPHA